MGTAKQNYVNHIAIVLDASSSMTHLASQVVTVADEQIKHLAKRSQELNQETRITVYVFADKAECVIYDKDVLRMPSLSKHYGAYGNTALIDATLLAIEDLSLTPQKYGDHAFLLFVLTDGEENRSRNRPDALSSKINGLPAHWTVAALVPNATGKHEAKRFGFLPDNVAVWDATSKRGLEEAGRVVRDATESFMTGRAIGVRGSRSVFSTGADAVNKDTIAAAGLTPMAFNQYKLVPVPKECDIKSL